MKYPLFYVLCLIECLTPVHSRSIFAQMPKDNSSVEWGEREALQKLPKTKEYVRLLLTQSAQICHSAGPPQPASSEQPWSLELYSILIDTDGVLVSRLYLALMTDKRTEASLPPPLISPPIRALAYRRTLLSFDRQRYVLETWRHPVPTPTRSQMMVLSHPFYIVHKVIMKIQSEMIVSPYYRFMTNGRTPHFPAQELTPKERFLTICGSFIRPELTPSSILSWHVASTQSP